MEFTFRNATEADLPEIRRLIAASVRKLQIEYSSSQREASIETVFSTDSRLIEDQTYFVAIAHDGRVAGCGGWSRRKTLFGGDHQLGQIEPELLDPTKDAAKIRAIFVHPDFARVGLGSRLLKMSEDAAAQEGFNSLEMGSTLTGIALYSSRGYVEIERVDVTVGKSEVIGIVRMRKNL